MTSLRLAAAALATLTLSACTTASSSPRDDQAASSTSAPATTVALSKARVLASLRAPVLEPFTATYRFGEFDPAGENYMYRLEVVVAQDADLNVSYTMRFGGKDAYQVVLHDSTVYARFLDDLGHTDEDDVRAEIGVLSGEWFPYEQWRDAGRVATDDPWFPVLPANAISGGSDQARTQLLRTLDLLPYESRVPISLAHSGGMVTPLLTACFKITGDGAQAVKTDGSARVNSRPDGTWRLTCDGDDELTGGRTDDDELHVVFVSLDEQGRLTSLTGNEAGSTNTGGFGTLSVTYGPQPSIQAPDTTWFAANKPAVVQALKPTGK